MAVPVLIGRPEVVAVAGEQELSQRPRKWSRRPGFVGAARARRDRRRICYHVRAGALGTKQHIVLGKFNVTGRHKIALAKAQHLTLTFRSPPIAGTPQPVFMRPGLVMLRLKVQKPACGRPDQEVLVLPIGPQAALPPDSVPFDLLVYRRPTHEPVNCLPVAAPGGEESNDVTRLNCVPHVRAAYAPTNPTACVQARLERRIIALVVGPRDAPSGTL